MAKLLLFIALGLALVAWLKRPRIPPAAPPAPKTPTGPQEMVECAQCGLHLPGSEALPGRGGMFCGEPHRAQYERTHAGP